MQFPQILRDAGLSVERHRDHFAPDCADEEWLREIGARHWAAITHDGRIRYKPNELVIDAEALERLRRRFPFTARKLFRNLAPPQPTRWAGSTTPERGPTIGA